MFAKLTHYLQHLIFRDKSGILEKYFIEEIIDKILYLLHIGFDASYKKRIRLVQSFHQTMKRQLKNTEVHVTH